MAIHYNIEWMRRNKIGVITIEMVNADVFTFIVEEIKEIDRCDNLISISMKENHTYEADVFEIMNCNITAIKYRKN